MPQRLTGYAEWIPDTYRILVLVDRNNDNCKVLKAKLETAATDAKLRTRTISKQKPHHVVDRLAIEELEAWYFGDWRAVRAAYPRVDATIISKAKYRNPDAIAGGTWETFERVLKQAGYFKNGLQKIKAARSIAEYMVPARNESRSFQVLREALRDMASAFSRVISNVCAMP